jgi:two-component system cell cycle sensor histidine kinase/response regulator CckA
VAFNLHSKNLPTLEEGAMHIRVSAKEAAEQVQASYQGKPALAQTILLVEDEAFVREVTREVLQSAGYRVLTAKNSLEAVHIFNQNGGEVRLLLTDVILPGQTGRDLAEQLLEDNPRLKVLLVTGYPEQIAEQNLSDAGLLAKPFSTGMLLQRVRHILDGEQTDTD